MQKSTLLPPWLRLWSYNGLAQTNGFDFIVNVGLSNQSKCVKVGQTDIFKSLTMNYLQMLKIQFFRFCRWSQIKKWGGPELSIVN